MVVTWTEELETGIKEIDDQHKEIIFFLSRIISNCSDCGERLEIIESIMKFISFVESHMSTEEKYMELYDYEDYESHASIHNVLKIGFAEMNAKYNHAGATSKYVHQICRVFVNWLIWHMNNEDRKMAEYLLTRNKFEQSNEI